LASKSEVGVGKGPPAFLGGGVKINVPNPSRVARCGDPQRAKKAQHTGNFHAGFGVRAPIRLRASAGAQRGLSWLRGPATPEQVRTHGWLFALADGVGGQEQGEVASRAAVESLLADFRAAAGGDLHTTLLPRLVQEANVAAPDLCPGVPWVSGQVAVGALPP